jgi:hypothetical protein
MSTRSGLWDFIRRLSKRRAQFSVADVVAAGWSYRQASNNCLSLVKRGELVVVRKGVGGRFDFRSAVYRKASK